MSNVPLFPSSDNGKPNVAENATPASSSEEPSEFQEPTLRGADSMPANRDFFSNLSKHRLSQDFLCGVKKAPTIQVRKPAKEWFIRTRSDLQFATNVLELKEEGEFYMVESSLWPELTSEPTFGPRNLHAAINRQGTLFVWPLRLPGPDGKLDHWSRSALEAAEMAQSRWIRVFSNLHLGAYEIFHAKADLPDPEWPPLSFAEILRVAFKGRVVQSLDHPVIKRLRGEV